MDRFVSIPREALAELLKASGSSLTPEDYVASLAETDVYRKYGSRATMAAMSKYFLLAAVIVSGVWTCLPIGFSFESVLVTVILAVVTFFEFRVQRAFRDRIPGAPALGFRNQVAFVIFIVAYCFYHAFAPVRVPADYREFMDPDTVKLVRMVSLVTYLTIAIVGGISQFCLAWYYRSARVRTPSEG